MAEQDNNPQAFSWPVRVYYEDTDIAGVVYYANYLRYFERARTEWLRALGFEQPDLASHHGVVFVVRTITVDYLAPARFNDALRVSVELHLLGASQIRLNQVVTRDDLPTQVLATAAVRIACVGMSTMKPVRIPRQIIEKIRPA